MSKETKVASAVIEASTPNVWKRDVTAKFKLTLT
jgi:hypothetical protein